MCIHTCYDTDSIDIVINTFWETGCKCASPVYVCVETIMLALYFW